MRFIAYFIYWVLLAPVILTVTLRVLTTPASLFATAIWPNGYPLLVDYGLGGLAIFSFAVAVGAVLWVWKKYRASVNETLATSSM